ncbi:MAG: twin-arginine translocase TatA/TatE family subunit [Planctomyces sp.]|nr:twin-arginine translocase TatA/TatE family subunit [Planctomyces sp.]
MIGAPWQILVILIVVLLLFGRRLPDLMRSLGSSVNEFKKGIRQDGEDEESGSNPSG